MDYNIQYIDIKYTLINTFLIGLSNNVLDISYSVDGKRLIIQIVLLRGTDLPEEVRVQLKFKLSEFEIVLKEIFIDKEEFNQSKGDWTPVHYQWLDYLLFSKAEII
jgi:intracellular septation protein A